MIGSPDIILVWPHGHRPAPPAPVSGYSVVPSPPGRDQDWIDIHRLATPWFAEPDLRRWLERYRGMALPDAVLVATDDRTGEPVATAGSTANSKDGMFPNGGQLAWVATVPEHRRRGLSHWLCTLATMRLVHEGYDNIVVSTGDDMPEAICVYRRLGYVPCLYAADQRERWAKICALTGLAFEPEGWPSVAEYVDGS